FGAVFCVGTTNLGGLWGAALAVVGSLVALRARPGRFGGWSLASSGSGSRVTGSYRLSTPSGRPNTRWRWQGEGSAGSPHPTSNSLCYLSHEHEHVFEMFLLIWEKTCLVCPPSATSSSASTRSSTSSAPPSAPCCKH